MLAFVGDANEGRLREVCTTSRGPCDRLGVLGAVLGIDGSGDNLRLFAGEEAIEETNGSQYIFGVYSMPCPIIHSRSNLLGD